MSNIMMQIRKKAQGEELDYTFIMDCLKDYKSPRTKLTMLLKNEDLIRAKKGIYLFGQDYRKTEYSPEIIANKIYGPSYVSREYALSYYGLIPEYVTEITSVTTKRSRNFNTPIGRFSYSHLPIEYYSAGFTIVQIRNNATCLFATAEKALSDLFYLRESNPQTVSELKDILFEDLRLDEEVLSRMKIGMIKNILKAGGPDVLRLLIEWLEKE